MVSIDPGLRTLTIVTWSCLGFPFALVPTSSFLAWSSTAKLTFEDQLSALYCLSCLSKNLYLEVGEIYICGHLSLTSLLFCICSLNPWVLFSVVRVSCWMSPSASWASSIFGGQALPWQSFLLLCHRRRVAGTRLIRTRIMFVQWASICFCQSSTYPSCRSS